MMVGDDDGSALQEILEISTVINGQVYISVSLIEAIRDTFVEKIATPSHPTMWDCGVTDVLSLLQEIIDSLTYEYAEELVPDAVPENL